MDPETVGRSPAPQVGHGVVRPRVRPAGPWPLVPVARRLAVSDPGPVPNVGTPPRGTDGPPPLVGPNVKDLVSKRVVRRDSQVTHGPKTPMSPPV